MRIKTRLEFRTVEVWKSLATSRRTVERRGGGARLTDVGSGRGEERKGSRWLEITAEGGAAERGKLTKASWRERRSWSRQGRSPLSCEEGININLFVC